MSSVQKLGVPVIFFTITAVHGSLKTSGEQRGNRKYPQFYTYVIKLLKNVKKNSYILEQIEKLILAKKELG